MDELKRIKWDIPDGVGFDPHDFVKWAKKKYQLFDEVFDTDTWKRMVPLPDGNIVRFQKQGDIANISIIKAHRPEKLPPEEAKERFFREREEVLKLKKEEFLRALKEKKEEYLVEEGVEIEWQVKYYAGLPFVDDENNVERSYLLLYEVPQENTEVCLNDRLESPDYVLGAFSGEDLFTIYMGDTSNVRFSEEEDPNDPRVEITYFKAVDQDPRGQGVDIVTSEFQESTSINEYNANRPFWDLWNPIPSQRYQFYFWYTPATGGPQPIFGDQGRATNIGTKFFEHIAQGDGYRYNHYGAMAWDGTFLFAAENEWHKTETTFKFPTDSYEGGPVFLPRMGIQPIAGPTGLGERWASDYPEYDVFWVPVPEDTPRTFRRHSNKDTTPELSRFNNGVASQTVFFSNPHIYATFLDSWAYPTYKPITDDYLGIHFHRLFGIPPQYLPFLRSGAQVVVWDQKFYHYKYIYPFADIVRMVPEAYEDWEDIHGGDGSSDEDDHYSEHPMPIGWVPYAVNHFHHGHPSDISDLNGTFNWYTTTMYVYGAYDPWSSFRQGTWDLASISPAFYYIAVYQLDRDSMDAQDDRLWVNKTNALFIDAIGEPVYYHNFNTGKVYWYPQFMVPMIGIKKIIRGSDMEMTIESVVGMEEDNGN